MIALSPCSCGSSAVVMSKLRHVSGHNDVSVSYRVRCDTCHRVGSEFDEYEYGDRAEKLAQRAWGYSNVPDPPPVRSDRPLVEDPYVMIARQWSETEEETIKRKARGRLIERLAKQMNHARHVAHEEDETPEDWDGLGYLQLPYRTMAEAAIDFLRKEWLL